MKVCLRLWIGVVCMCLAEAASSQETCSPQLKNVNGSSIFACESENGGIEYCSSRLGSHCKKLNFSSSEERLRDHIASKSGYAGRKAMRSLQRQDHPKKRALLAFIDLTDWRKPIRVKSEMVIQTGPYGKLELNEKPLEVKCLAEIMHAAYLLETHFSQFTFQIDGDIKECKNLKAGVDELVQNKSRVKKNIAKFHSPMHTVYLTTQTKFNHFLIGKMGLYINVNRSNEIPHRLIEFRVGKAEINHETTSL